MEHFFQHNLHISAIVLACYVAPKQGNPYHPNRPSYGLALNLAGAKLYEFENGKTLKVGESSMILLPKKSSYTVKELQPGDCYAINFQLYEEIPLEPFVLKIKDLNPVLHMFQSAEKAFRLKRFDFEMKCMAELYSILCAMHKENSNSYSSGKNRSLLLPALEYIHSEYPNDNISIEYLAGLCGIKSAYFRRIFGACLGTSPLKYINTLKLNRAKDLLSSGLYTVNAAMELSGFSDPCYFSRLFREDTGVSPSEFMRTVKAFGSTPAPPL